jgi:arylsulfatase A-like enzyme
MMKPNILFLVIDGLRADSCIKNSTSITPNIDNLIKNGISFNQAISSGPSSTPAVSSLFTSLYPFECLVQDGKINKLNPNIDTHVKKLNENGYSTHAMIQDVLSHMGFEEIFGEKNLTPYDHSSKKLWSGLGNDILNKIDSLKAENPWFFYVQVYDFNLLIYPYDERYKTGPEEITDSKYGNNHYERILSVQDKWIGKILEKIDQENTLVVFTADHGLESGAYDKKLQDFDNLQRIKRNIKPGTSFQLASKIKSVIPFRKKIVGKYKDHIKNIKEEIQKSELEKLEKLDLTIYQKRLMEFSIKPTSHLYDDRLHIPLIFYGYDIPKGRSVNDLVRSIDIFPTIMDLISAEKKIDNNRGQSFFPLLINEKSKRIMVPAFIESTVNIIDSTDANVIGLRTSKYKYFRDRKNPLKNIHLYDLENDPKEENNISMESTKKIEEFENELIRINSKREFLIKDSSNKLDLIDAQKIEEKLRSAGYIN